METTFDLSLSMLKAAGVSPPHPLDGSDILGFLARGGTPPGRTLFWRARRGQQTWRAVRESDLKYISHTDNLHVEEFLFQLAQDPGEQKNLLAARSADVARLKEKLAAWEASVRPAR